MEFDIEIDLVSCAKAIMYSGSSIKAIEQEFQKLKVKSDLVADDLNDFNSEADKLPYGCDLEYGALLLERLAERRKVSDRLFFLKAALRRAEHCRSLANTNYAKSMRGGQVSRLLTQIHEIFCGEET